MHSWYLTLIRWSETPEKRHYSHLSCLLAVHHALSSVLQIFSLYQPPLLGWTLGDTAMFNHFCSRIWLLTHIPVNASNNILVHQVWFQSVFSFLSVLSRWWSSLPGLMSHNRYFQDSFSFFLSKEGIWISVSFNYMWFVPEEGLHGFIPFRIVLLARDSSPFCYLNFPFCVAWIFTFSLSHVHPILSMFFSLFSSPKRPLIQPIWMSHKSEDLVTDSWTRYIFHLLKYL